MYSKNQCRRIEALERAARRHRQRVALVKMRDRALNTLSDETLADLWRFFRAVHDVEDADPAAWDAYHAFEAALEREKASSTGLAPSQKIAN